MKLTEIIPQSIAQDKKLFAIADALNNALEYIHDNKDLVLLLPNLDKLPDDILDHLAVAWHVDEYSSDLPIDIKRSLIRDSLAFHKIKGTPAAVIRTLEIFMVAPYIKEWFEYGGQPYYFKIFAQSMRDIGDGDLSFWRMLWDAKNVRSWLESITIDFPTDDFPHFHGVGEQFGDNLGFTSIDSEVTDSDEIISHGIGENIAGNDITNIDTDFNMESVFFNSIAACEYGCDTVGVDFSTNQVDSVSYIAPVIGSFEYGNDTIAADYIPIDPEPMPDYDNYLKVYFQFPAGSAMRIINFANPRDDIRGSDILKLNYNIILNRQGFISNGICRAIAGFKSVQKVV